MLNIFEMEQGSPEWFEVRRGIPTASEFQTVLAEGRKKGTPSISRAKYARRLAGELITGKVEPGYTNEHMERGKEMEEEARKWYAIFADEPLTSVGFCRRGRSGASPDSLVGDDGLLEIKTKLPHRLIECIEGGVVPPEHWAQCQGALWVTGRKWIDFVAYWPGMPGFIKRAKRDEFFIAELARAVEDFNREVDVIVAEVVAYQSRRPE